MSQAFVDFEVLNLHDVQVQVVPLANLEPRKLRKASFVRIFAEEPSVHRDANAGRVEAQSDFKNLLELERKAAVRLGVTLDQPKMTKVLASKLFDQPATHSTRSLTELLRKTFLIANLTSM